MRFLALLILPTVALAQPDEGPPRGPIDACGVLVQDGSCVLFQGGGGLLFLSDYGGFKAGDAVRVTGTITDCVTLCEADGCVAGAVVYDPTVLPCGEPLPDFPGDICAGVAAGLVGGLAGGIGLAYRGRRISHFKPRG